MNKVGHQSYGPGGEALVADGIAGIPRCKEVATVNATVRTLTFPNGIESLEVTVVQDGAGTANLAAVVALCVNASSDADATLTLAPTNGELYSGRELLHVGKSKIQTDGKVYRVDLKRLVGGETLTVSVAGVEVPND